MSDFKWNKSKEAAALSLAAGETQAEAAAEAGVDPRTLYRWLAEPDFAEEVDRLTLMTGIASRAERLRLIKRVVKQMTADDGTLSTNKDLLEWMKLSQAETDGIKLDISQLAAALGADDAPLADGG